MNKVIFVNGTARCGSTLVDLILGNDPRGFSLGEVCNWFRRWRTHHFDIKCGCGVYPCEVWESLKHVREKDLYRSIFDRYDVDFIVDSSKRLTWIIDQNMRLRAQDVRVYNLVLYKDPVSLFHSRWKRGKRDLDETVRQYEYYARIMAAGIPFVAVNYDWLVAELEEALPRLCDRLDVPYAPGKEQFWRKTHHHLFGSFGPRRQLFADDPQIYRESFLADYEEAADEYRRQFVRSVRLQTILRSLAERDLRINEAASAAMGGQVRRPPFYYKQRLKELKMRFFPAPWPDREASTIQEWRL